MIFAQPETPGTVKTPSGAPQAVTAQSLAAAAILRTRCPVTDGGSVVVIAPVARGSSGSAVQSLSSALEQIGAGPVLRVQLGSNPVEGAAAEESSPVYLLSAANGDLSVQPYAKGTGTPPSSGLARIDLSAGVPALISSDKYQELIRTLKTSFRFILVEGPPLGVAAETLLLAQKSDALVFTVREGKTEIQDLAEAKRLAERARIAVLGFFFERSAKRGRLPA